MYLYPENLTARPMLWLWTLRDVAWIGTGLLLQGLITPGMSGGGAFTEDGVFVGILCGGDEEGKVAVVPYSMIETERP